MSNFTTASSFTTQATPQILRVVSTAPASKPVASVSGFTWTNTLIIVVAVSSYVALCILVCIIYRCAKARGMRGKCCGNRSLNCAPLHDCLGCSCLDGGMEKEDPKCKWCCTRPSVLDSLLDKCFPKNLPKPQCLDMITCKGLKINLTCPKFCMNAEKTGLWNKFLAKRRACVGPRRPPICCRYESDAACCGYENGKCRFFCLECTVRDRKRPGTPHDPGSVSATPTPLQPGWIFPPSAQYPNGAPIFSVQPNGIPPYFSPQPGYYPGFPNGQPYYSLNDNHNTHNVSLAGSSPYPFQMPRAGATLPEEAAPNTTKHQDRLHTLTSQINGGLRHDWAQTAISSAGLAEKADQNVQTLAQNGSVSESQKQKLRDLLGPPLEGIVKTRVENSLKKHVAAIPVRTVDLPNSVAR